MEKMILSNKEMILKKIDDSYYEAMKNVGFQNLVNRLNVSDDKIKKIVSKLEDTCLDLENCKNCSGLYECKNILPGHVNYPRVFDEKIIFSYTKCRFQKYFDSEKILKEKSKNVLDYSRMKDIDINDKNRFEVIKFLKVFFDSYSLNKITKGLYLHGSFGAGKTFLISCLFNELKEKKNINYLIVYFPELLRNLRDDFTVLDDKLNHIKNVSLLLIDDIGAEKVTDWGRDEILGSILQYRMNEGLSTFFTSNLNIFELETHLSLSKNSEDSVKSRRIIERVKQLTVDIELISVNKRN